MCVLSVEHGGDEGADLLGVMVLGVFIGFTYACEAFAVGGGAFGADGFLGLTLPTCSM